MPAGSKARKSALRGQQAKAAATRIAASTIANTDLRRMTQSPLAGPAGIVFDQKLRWPADPFCGSPEKNVRPNRERSPMRKALLIIGFLALAIGLLWIGQGTGAIAWPAQSFMIGSLQWAEYGALLSAIGLILIWQGKR